MLQKLSSFERNDRKKHGAVPRYMYMVFGWKKIYRADLDQTADLLLSAKNLDSGSIS